MDESIGGGGNRSHRCREYFGRNRPYFENKLGFFKLFSRVVFELPAFIQIFDVPQPRWTLPYTHTPRRKWSAEGSSSHRYTMAVVIALVTPLGNSRVSRGIILGLLSECSGVGPEFLTKVWKTTQLR